MKNIFILLFLMPSLCFGQDLEVKKLSKNVYQYTSWADMGSWGRIGSNGLIAVDSGKALLVDTPIDEAKTKELLQYIADSLNAEVVSFIPGHWHDDCVGAMAYLRSLGVKTYANRLTNDILQEKGLPTAEYSFINLLTLHMGKITAECYFLGGGHATDNIVIWLPKQHILFGGCMVKDCTSTTLGNISDASPLLEWRATIEKLQHKFRKAKMVVPGHGSAGGTELFEHTIKLLAQ